MEISERISVGVNPARRKSRVLVWLVRSLVALLALLAAGVLAGGLWLRAQLSGSLPRLSGEHAVTGLASPVTIERDALGIPTIRGASRLDVARATGFAHAQERFFQMDFQRRHAAGELAELAGEGLLRLDRKLRVHRFRAEAPRILARSSPEMRSLIEAYAKGVNEGLAALEKKPFEYLLLGAEPAPWKPEDTVLVQLSMFVSLQDEDGEYESMLGLMQEKLPPELFRFLTPRGTEWDAPLVGEGPAPVPVPGPEALKPAPALPRAASLGRRAAEPEGEAASNAWALAGRHTASGRPLLAVDMHLGLSVPNIWYRAAFAWPDGAGGEHRVVGVTLPGVPIMVVGSNGSISWGFTNSRIDTSDLVVVEPDPRDPEAYLTPSGPARYQRFREELRIRGEDRPEILDVRWTQWGPVLGKDHAGRFRALRWVAHDPEAVDLEIGALERARSVAEAVETAHRSGIPAQSLLVVDAAGHIGWTIAGRIPRREGFDGRVPSSWTDGRRWNGWLAGEEIPRLVDPADGRLWSANQRIVDGEALARLGDGNYVLGARARQIRDRLRTMERATPREMLVLQLDDRALFLERWQKLLLQLLDPEALAADPRRRELREQVERWGGRATVDSVGYRAVREFREEAARQAFGFLTAECARLDPEFDYVDEHKQAEAPLWALVTQRPPHLLDPRYRTWEELLLAAADAVVTPPAGEDGEEAPPLAERTWGQRNTAAIGHLFSRAIPGARRWLDMPAEPLPGDEDMPLVQRPSYGSSQRMAVSPGAEAEGIFHMPGGQSGHPLSAHYGDSHAAWARGEASPFLPGAEAHRLILVPKR
ncbi:MAG TPA: penicillin acylase family protein [Thermoanaerobaculia bacterium]|nr:penicillin acylase family protein [Thermoanaerobaculia bacterium]